MQCKLFVFQALIHIWSFEKFLINLVFVKGIYSNLGPMLKAWEEYKTEYFGLKRRYIRDRVAKSVLAIDIVFLLISVFNVFFLAIYMKEITHLLLTPLFADSEVPLYASFIFYIVYFYMAFGWLQTIVFTCICCFLLRKEFLCLTDDFRSYISNDSQKRAKLFTQEITLEGFRRRHHCLHVVVCHLDEMLGLFCLIVLALSVPLTCMFIYMLFHAYDLFGDDSLAIAAMVTCILVVVLHVIAITVAATSLATAVR